MAGHRPSRRLGCRLAIGVMFAAMDASAQTVPVVTSPTVQPTRAMEDFGRTYFESGTRAFSERRFTDAARDFREAHNITHRPELLFNIARALEGAEDLHGALEAYSLFDAAGAPGYDRMALQRDMASLRTRIAALPPPPPPTPVPVVVPAPVVIAPPPAPLPQLPPTRTVYHRSWVNNVGPWVLMGLGGLSGVVGILSAVGAAGDINTINQVNSGTLPWSANVATVDGRASGEVTTAWVFGLGGAAVLGGGVAWLLLRGPGTPTEVPIQAMITPTPGGATFLLGGSM